MADAPDDEYDQTIEDAAKFFNVHIRTVQKWANDGTLPGTRTPGGTRFRWRFRRSDFHALAAAHSNQPKEASA